MLKNEGKHMHTWTKFLINQQKHKHCQTPAIDTKEQFPKEADGNA